MSLKKERLLAIINRALNSEEEAVQTISRNISSAIEFLEKDTKAKDKVKTIMEQLSQESTAHAKILYEIKELIAKEKKDVY